MTPSPRHRLLPTLNIAAAGECRWDVIVVGCGPAGSIAARELCRLGAKVLLVDRARFPRAKVCGCCLNNASLRMLQDLGLGREVFDEETGTLPGRELREFRLFTSGSQAAIPIPLGLAISREQLDARLLHSAIAVGAEFLDNTLGLIDRTVDGFRLVRLRDLSRTAGQSIGGCEASALARIVLVASGLGTRVFVEPDAGQRTISRGSRIGAGTVVDVAENSPVNDGAIYMACHRFGYVGMVNLEDGRLDVAAALEAQHVKRFGGIGGLIEFMLRAAGAPVPVDISHAKWQGTARLTQYCHAVFGERYFVIGDAAGYVEPFTGEGMAWAISTGRSVAPLVMQSLQPGTQTSGPQWQMMRRRLIGRRSLMCRVVSQSLRYPALVQLSGRLLARHPGLARPLLQTINRPYGSG